MSGWGKPQFSPILGAKGESLAMKRIVLSVCAAVAAAVSARAENLIQNGTFDGPGTKINGDWSCGSYAGFACPNWNCSNWNVPNSSGSGLSKPGSTWLTQENAAKAGTYSLFIQSKTVYQEFAVPAAGRYQLSFDTCGRSGYLAKAAEVYLAHNGKTNLICLAEYSGTAYKTFTKVFTLYGAGLYTLILSKSELSDGLKCINYDNVSIELLEAYHGCVVDGSPLLSASGGRPVYGPISLSTGERTVLTAPAGVVSLDGGGLGEVTGWTAYKGGDESDPWRSGAGNVCDDYVQPDETVRFIWNWQYYSGATASSGGEVRIDGGAWTNLAVCTNGEHQLEARAFDGYAFWRWTGETSGIADVYAASTTATLDESTIMAVFVPTNTVRVPAGYRELEFIEGTGKQRINTELHFDSDLVFRMRFNYAKSGGGCYFGTGSGTRSARFFAYNNGLYMDIAGLVSGYTRTILSGYKANTVCEVEVGNAFIRDLETGAKSTSTKMASVNDEGPMCLFNTSSDYGRVFYLRVLNAAGLKGDFVPAQRLSDNAIGLWDNVTERFFENVGEGTLVAGNPYNDGEYLTVTAEPQEHVSTLVPDYGKTSGWYAGRTQNFSAEPLAGEDLRIAPTKWRVLTRPDITAEYVQQTNGTGGAFTYVHDGHNTKVIWTWETQYRLTARSEGPGAVQFDDGDVAYCVTNWSVTGEGTVTLRAIPHADKHFLYWTGDLVGIEGSLYDPEIACSLANAQARTITAVFSDNPFPLCHWTGSGDGKKFEDPANWASERVPGEDDDVLVLSPYSLDVQATEAHVLKSLTVLGTQSSTVSLAFLSNLTVRTDIEVGANGTLETARTTTVSNDVHIAAGGVVTHALVSTSLNDPSAVKECLDWTVLGDMTVDASGLVNVTGKGLASHKGAWIDDRSTHGGRYDNTSKACYGSVFHPFAYGSGGHSNDKVYGGGVVRLRVAGTLTVNGSILADGVSGGWYWSAAGGSIDVSCGTLAGAGIIRAEGGYMTNTSRPCGGGGRIAVRQTAGRDFTSDWSGTVSAYGTRAPSREGTPAAGCGTVYLQSAADAEGGGRIVVDNAEGNGYTDFPMKEDGSPKRAYRAASLELGAGSTLVLTNDVTVFDLDVKHAKAKIDLNGRTLTIRSKAHEGGEGWAAPTGTCVTAHGGSLIWGQPGFAIIVR